MVICTYITILRPYPFVHGLILFIKHKQRRGWKEKDGKDRKLNIKKYKNICCGFDPIFFPVTITPANAPNKYGLRTITPINLNAAEIHFCFPHRNGNPQK